MASTPTILITGANGQLGKEFQAISSSFTSFQCIFLSKEELSIHDKQQVNDFFKKHQPAYLINCAAYTAVDKAETEKESAYHINSEAVGALASICKEYNTRFIHISTDYVFDGKATTPYTEDSPTHPQSVYGASKLEGEMLAMKLNPSSIVIRTSWVYSTFGKNFVKTMLRLMSEKPSINVVNDQAGSPTYAADLAEAIKDIIVSGNWQPGIYHYSNSGIISWFEFATAIKELSHSSCIVNPIPSSQYPTPAMRPGYSALNTNKINHTFRIPIKEWKSSLAVCLSKL
ncbi:MAG: dTDP-4-dehydrorhamnose reductase [Chitinophagaceae bacterium]